ncbi:MAG: outer membrane protein assembly factor BamA [Gammaproteobacteria bacterium]|nr:outer membrane protein assembly factor BamA [Gammaproteobacteria bacterium]MDH3370612.1 outer membrane protein assembly factor BamA [Gammaproteobacteria bacterium]MDH3405442.1 outer membrane protein assembly factor BamA [Gammaproteobacteria bacterium]MDH5486068.1 outer membrane protein assembly factor BamA [Gammaproteobacteria bacterium]
MKRFIAALFLLIHFISVSHAMESFVIKDIRVEGLQRISAGTVFNYLPVKVGDTFTEKKSQDAVRVLFKTGFFRDVQLEREKDVLIVTVVERPSIAGIKIIGTREMSEEDLKKGLKEIGLAEGRVFNKSLLDRVEQELRQQYFSRGYYGVSIQPTMTPLERNRVDLNIEVIEGSVARIREIALVGNQLFPDKQLLKLFTLGPKSWYALFSSRDKYSKQKLAGDLERLRNFYQDQGFLEFNIDSTQVSITPDKESIYITINFTEGKRYVVKSYKLSGTFPVPESVLHGLISIKPGDVFSRKAVTETTKKISDRLANDGYAFANVNAIPDVDKDKSEVVFTFFIDPGRRIYVRRVNFAGNIATRDEVLRREMRQLEGGWYNAEKIQRSRVRLQRLGYFDDVNVETPTVVGVADQVDVNINVKERPTGNLILGVGYSDSDGLLLNARVTQSNLFGTGKELSVSFDNSASTTNYNIRYVNPYYTKDGLSRGFNIFSSTIDAALADTAAYSADSQGVGVFYGIPLSEDNKVDIGADVERIDLHVNSTSAQVAQDFVAVNGDSNTVLKTTLGWSRDTLDSLLLPTSGSLQRLTAEIALPGTDIEYYRLTYLAGRYWPLSPTYTFKVRGELGYGNGYGDQETLPFYKNFYAGGSSTVRGFSSRSLGPRDTLPPNDPIGGNRRVLVNAELLFPLPGSTVDDKSMRISLFTDGGMVYGPGEKVDLGQLRYSAGIAFNWFSPVGPISFSYAIPLNDKPGDRKESFQFTLGVPLR